MGEGFARLLIDGTALYLAMGLLFALAFALHWAGKLDQAAASGSWGFRLLIVPGATLLWPLLLYRVLRSR